MSNVVVNIPSWFELDDLVVINTIINEKNPTFGTLIASDNINLEKPYRPRIRVYLIKLDNDKFNIEKELGSFTFKTQNEALDFSEKFSTISAVELLHKLHSEQVAYAI
ncbi:hypothetical protein [Ureibacillus endophyticus]|uniref:Uncharacterized protein n=1 Tax=Ureibacillus endophyticus TaxID=1978490 RepID=A0A494Z961_9BACL|nr:hypothetical protein [Lysinibacillus endophyticus]RKQ19174.1 hypothetical protein D8M03_03740 [Lysinibacillus endophyticus]